MTRKEQMARTALLIVFALAVVTACGKSAAPTSPSATTTPPQAGATITGTVDSTTTGASAGYRGLGTSGITITVAGTGIAITTDGQGKFTLSGVPAGTVTLLLTAGGGTATITLTNVKETDEITLKITLKGTAATLDSEQRKTTGTGTVELEDRITAVNPAGTTRTIDVGSQRVSVPTTADVRHGSTVIDFLTLKVGDRVHVKGTMSGSLLVADQVIVQNTNANVPVNVNGSVSSLVAGFSCPAIRFVVDGWTVETSVATDFQKASCSSIAAGTKVHVKGDVQGDTGRVLATWVQVDK